MYEEISSEKEKSVEKSTRMCGCVRVCVRGKTTGGSFSRQISGREERITLIIN